MTLVALCFTAVIGITLASYIAVCSRAMNLSNRSFQGSLSKQLAELGVEEALRALNKNLLSGTDTTAALADWSTGGVTADWTLDLTNDRATATITFPTTKFDQGVTGSVKIRIDNYDAAHLGSTWNSATNYRIGDLVGLNGIWYRSIRNNNTNQTPSTTNLTWWITGLIPWEWRTSASYQQFELVNFKGIWYRCITAHTSDGTTTYTPKVPLPVSTATTYWTPIPSMRAWASSTPYALYDVVAYTDPTTSDLTLYRCVVAHTSGASFGTDLSKWTTAVRTLSLPWSINVVHTRGSIVWYDRTWYYCRKSGTSSTAPNTDTAMWASFIGDGTETASDDANPPAANTEYNPMDYWVGDYIYRSGAAAWYRCHTAHTFAGWATSGGNWVSARPYLYWAYRYSLESPTQTYPFNSVNFWGSTSTGYWWRCRGPAWSWEYPSPRVMHSWVSGYIYNPGDVVYDNSTTFWYRCLVAHTSSGTILPSSTVYWAPNPLYSAQWDSGRLYNQNHTVRHNGVWYLSLLNSNTNQNPITATTYWIGANTSTSSYIWNASTAYAVGNYRCYGGAWYRCIAATTANAGHSPNNTTYWTASWAQGWGVSTGTPVIYSESTINVAGSPSIQTQLRTTIAPAPLFPNAVAATTTISANSGGTVDSYDSSLGTTYASQVGGANNYSAVVAAANTSSTAVTLSTTAVMGYVAAPSSSTSPHAPLFSSGGSVKGLSSPVSPNIDLTRVSRSPHIPKFDPQPAGGLTASWATVPKGVALVLSSTIQLGTPGDITPSRYYYAGNLTIDGTTVSVINIDGPVILYIQGDLTLSGTVANKIVIASTGSAEIHVGDGLKINEASGGIVNLTQDPKKVILICDSATSDSQFFSDGDNDFYGVIYLPNTTAASGFFNDNSLVEIFGAVSAKKITYSGANMNVHYDTSLRYATFGGVDQFYTINEWRELPLTEWATLP